jgi:hypothetical protein
MWRGEGKRKASSLKQKREKKGKLENREKLSSLKP